MFYIFLPLASSPSPHTPFGEIWGCFPAGSLIFLPFGEIWGCFPAGSLIFLPFGEI